MIDKIIEWQVLYRINNIDTPDRLALKARELKALKDEFKEKNESAWMNKGESLMRWPEVGPVTVLGLLTVLVDDDYAGLRVWKRELCCACGGSGDKNLETK